MHPPLCLHMVLIRRRRTVLMHGLLYQCVTPVPQSCALMSSCFLTGAAPLTKSQKKSAKKKAKKKAAAASAVSGGGANGGDQGEEEGLEEESSPADSSTSASVSGSAGVPTSAGAVDGPLGKHAADGTAAAVAVAVAGPEREPQADAQGPSVSTVEHGHIQENGNSRPLGSGAGAAAAGDVVEVPLVVSTPGLSEEQLRDAACKVVDFGNACWTYKQFTNDVQTRQYR